MSIRPSNQIEKTVCLLAIPGFTPVLQGDLYFAHRLANSLSEFDACLIAPKTPFAKLSRDTTYKHIDIEDTELAIEKINQAALVIKCPLLRADVPNAYLPILQSKKMENRFLTIQEYGVNRHFTNEAEAAKNGLSQEADLLTGPGPGRLGIFISDHDARNEFNDLSDQLGILKTEYNQESLRGFGYGHTKSLALFPWLVSQTALSCANNRDPTLVILILGRGKHLKINDLKDALRKVHTDNHEDGDVILMDLDHHQELISKGSAEKKPLHILIIPAPILHDDMKILEEVVAENKGLLHVTGDQTVSDWAGLNDAPRFLYESLPHKQTFHYLLTKNSEEATGKPLIGKLLAMYNLAYHYGFKNSENKKTKISKAKDLIRETVIPELMKADISQQYQQFSSHLKKTANLGTNIRTFVAKQLGIKEPEICKKRKAPLDDNGW